MYVLYIIPNEPSEIIIYKSTPQYLYNPKRQPYKQNLKKNYFKNFKNLYVLQIILEKLVVYTNRGPIPLTAGLLPGF
jgi:hypothetical protein